jgi:site-specific recombinase XerD
LSELKPYIPLKSKAMWYISSKIYEAASIRQKMGDRRGTHLFRYNLATSFAGKGIARQVISDTLGHANPNSLDYYLFADITHLRECALSITDFPVNEEVFQI